MVEKKNAHTLILKTKRTTTITNVVVNAVFPQSNNGRYCNSAHQASNSQQTINRIANRITLLSIPFFRNQKIKSQKLSNSMATKQFYYTMYLMIQYGYILNCKSDQIRSFRKNQKKKNKINNNLNIYMFYRARILINLTFTCFNLSNKFRQVNELQIFVCHLWSFLKVHSAHTHTLTSQST